MRLRPEERGPWRSQLVIAFVVIAAIVGPVCAVVGYGLAVLWEMVGSPWVAAAIAGLVGIAKAFASAAVSANETVEMRRAVSEQAQQDVGR